MKTTPGCFIRLAFLCCGIWGAEALRAVAESEAESKKQAATEARLRDAVLGPQLNDMARAFSQVNDEVAMTVAESILSQFPDCGPAKSVVADLSGRKKRKAFGKKPEASAPRTLEAWIEARHFAPLVARLDDVSDVRLPWVLSDHDWRVKALIRIGDAAVPALIDVIENDERLTRSIRHWDPYLSGPVTGPGCWIPGVREAALTAVMSILKVRVFEAGTIGYEFTLRGPENAKQIASELRAYWARYGRFPFHERMMEIIRDPNITGERLREAVSSLAVLDDEVRFATTLWRESLPAQTLKRENLAIAKFSNPTAAEAILRAMKRDLAAFDTAKPDAEVRENHREEIEIEYVKAFAELGDKRIAKLLIEEAAGVARRHRLLLSWAANRLGDRSGLAAISSEVGDGRWPIDQDERSVGRLMDFLSSSGLPEAEAAFAALRDANHPARATVISMCAKAARDVGSDPPWIYRPFVIPLLRSALDDINPTGWKYSIDRRYDGYSYSHLDGDGGWGASSRPPHLKNDDDLLLEAPERICDQAAIILGELIWTVPRAHPLLRDNEKRLEELRREAARFTYRVMTDAEDQVRYSAESEATLRGMIPDMVPLSRPATSADVADGKALFSLGSRGTVLPLKLPARATFTVDSGGKHPRSAIIVQAEKDENGGVHYGVFFRGGTGEVKDIDLSDIRPIVKIKKE